ncbi:restriction endonuclease [Halalkalicoccus sp. GCM10025322]|uniref:restriction endonuclease n=2 Tax=Halococcaceae TaxID=1963270 RepID=UPI002F969EAE
MTSEPSLLRHLRAMDNYAFEMLIADVWEGFGYDTTVSQESNDKGLDVMAIHRETGERVAIQAKCYAGSNRIGRPAVQQYSSLYQQENADRVYIVSTGYYTDTAIESGRELGVGLITGIDLCREIADLEHGDEITQYYLNRNAPSRRRWGKIHAQKSFTLRVVVALLGGIYLLGGYGAIAAATSIPMISQLHPLFAFFSMGTNPGFGLIFLSVLAIGFVLLKWASLWRWKVAGVLIPASWFAVAMAGTMESNPAFWIQATILSVAFLSPIIVPAMFSFGAHHWILRGLRASVP